MTCQCRVPTVLNGPLWPRVLVLRKAEGIWEISELPLNLAVKLKKWLHFKHTTSFQTKVSDEHYDALFLISRVAGSLGSLNQWQQLQKSSPGPVVLI